MRRASWRWHRDGDLIAEIDETRHTLELARLAERSNPGGLDAQAPRLERRLNELAERAASEAVLFVVRALPADDFEDIKRKHPPSSEDLDRWREMAKVSPFVDMPEMNWRTMGADLLVACLDEPEWDETEIRKWWAEASLGDRRAIWNKALGVQVDSADVPFFNAATDMTGGGGNGSITRSPTESPSQSS